MRDDALCSAGCQPGQGSLDSFADLEGRLRIGDQGAATEVVRRFDGRLVALARAELDARLRRKEDPEDVVQSVYRSFFTRHRAGQFDLGNWGSLWGLLAVITVRKCLSRAEYYRAGRRDVAGEVNVASRREAASGFGEVIDREPTPMESAILAETIEGMMRGLGPDDRTIIELSLQGYSSTEIAARVGRCERTVRRARQHAEDRLHRMREREILAQ